MSRHSSFGCGLERAVTGWLVWGSERGAIREYYETDGQLVFRFLKKLPFATTIESGKSRHSRCASSA
jgi:hypothetical protein